MTGLDAMPPSIIGVPTAIPAFIGYTERAADPQGKALYNRPVAINSLAEYQLYFGGGFSPLYRFDEATPQGGAPPGRYDFAAPDGRQTIYVTLTPSRPARFTLYNSIRLFYANGGGPCYVVSVASYADAGVDKAKLEAGLAAIREQPGPTMLVVPDAVNLPPSGGSGNATSRDFADVTRLMLEQCAALQDRMAILDVWGADKIIQTAPDFQQRLDACIANFQAAVGDGAPQLSYGAAYFPFLDTTIVQRGEIDYTGVDPAGDTYATLRRYLAQSAAQLYARDAAACDTARALIQRLYPPNDPQNPKDPPVPGTKAEIAQLNQALCAALPLLQQIEDVMAERANRLPPSGAVAGLFTANDLTRGVWTAPANVGLNAVTSPSLKLDDAQQVPLNAPPNGKAVNVIRFFVGRGPVVWGARTLDGNSPDWRYVQVRRTILYVEQSITAALAPFAFAANNGATWVTVVSMISSFLVGLWQQGGLMGDKASDAFTVQCGLGSTMTGQDILEGTMIVQVTLQMIRPAEFMELTFRQKMQGTG